MTVFNQNNQNNNQRNNQNNTDSQNPSNNSIHLAQYKKEMINAVREMRDQLREHLDEYPVRSGEGSVQRR